MARPAGEANLSGASCVSGIQMRRMTRLAAALAMVATLAACQPLREQKDEAVHNVAAGLMSTVIEAQSADAQSDDVEFAKLTPCDTPCDKTDVAPVETCSVTGRSRVPTTKRT